MLKNAGKYPCSQLAPVAELLAKRRRYVIPAPAELDVQVILSSSTGCGGSGLL